MFGIFKQKEISQKLLKENVLNVIIDTWANESLLPFKKFQSFTNESEWSESRSYKTFMAERLRFISSVAITVLRKNNIEEEFIDEIIYEVTNTVKTVDVPELKNSANDLGVRAKKYAEIRFSDNPRIAGKLIEDHFSLKSFGYKPSDNSVDQRYTLYKSLSSFERSTIFEISNTIRKSRI
jgi:hypothetical protein